MLKIMGVFAICSSLPMVFACATTRERSVYESSDGTNVLVVDSEYYYLGTSDYPSGPEFLKKYGQKIQLVDTSDGTCLSLGIFKIAKFKGASTVCGNVKISKHAVGNGKGLEEYSASCATIEEGECSRKTQAGGAPFEYEYQVEEGRGVVTIFIGGKDNSSANNVLLLKSGKGILG